MWSIKYFLFQIPFESLFYQRLEWKKEWWKSHLLWFVTTIASHQRIVFPTVLLRTWLIICKRICITHLQNPLSKSTLQTVLYVYVGISQLVKHTLWQQNSTTNFCRTLSDYIRINQKVPSYTWTCTNSAVLEATFRM